MGKLIITCTVWFLSLGGINGKTLLMADTNVREWKFPSDFGDPASFHGLYNGYFGQSPIEITLEVVSEDGKASGFSLHKGIKRPFNGTWEKVPQTTKVKFVLYEPGDNKFDGHFELLFDAVSFDAEGTWFPKPESGLSATMVSLKKQ